LKQTAPCAGLTGGEDHQPEKDANGQAALPLINYGMLSRQALEFVIRQDPGKSLIVFLNQFCSIRVVLLGMISV